MTTYIIDILRRDNAPKIDDLFEKVKRLYSLERSSFERSLMTLELQGIVRVYKEGRKHHRVELVLGNKRRWSSSE